MRAITVDDEDAHRNLTVADVPENPLAAGRVRVAVAAAGVNRADLLQRAGHYPPPPGASEILGLEVSGVVQDVGPGVTDWSPGDAVCALLDGGGYAERVDVPAAQLLPVPAGIDLVDAAALPEAACTAWSNLVDVARLQPGETLLVHGGSGGVGSFAIQLGVALGARVATTAGGPERVARCRDLGAAVGIDHRTQDAVAAVRAATDGRGADVVLDVVGAAALGDNVRVLATGGRLVVIGMQKGRRGELDLGALLTKRASVAGTTLRARPLDEKAAIVAAVRAHVWPHVEAGRIRPVVHARVPLAEAARAHTMLESGEAFGKVLLTT
ncbi:putative PIG3 family NAD(P)H quinone oxidoreductase [Sediminihabitans luteus]|uniref:Putative PIG3 family NAD(P)H quinone oxidoreductase n=1 Tax=Sediminihabitans luteus TaxID=1138585 RepID=A0A2M9CC55_9CELL|nr:NAD(P)H-quinone oxidoreductase [Sediminihabitans luteus]PJJ68641.1 putative PIG3 family NAD(P)H quinone oxidoreductase [Sediminihabitans luteus]